MSHPPTGHIGTTADNVAWQFQHDHLFNHTVWIKDSDGTEKSMSFNEIFTKEYKKLSDREKLQLD